MAGVNKHMPGCTCCQCPVHICLRPYCVLNGQLQPGYQFNNVTAITNYQRTIAGAAVELNLAGSVVATGTTATGGTCTTLNTAGTYGYTITATGYESVTGSIAAACLANVSASPRMRPTSATYRVRSGFVNCLIPGIGVTVTGGAGSFTGTTDALGEVVGTLTMPAGYTDSVSISCTPPLNAGADAGPHVYSYGTVVPCAGTYTLEGPGVPPDASHHSGVAADKYLPRTITIDIGAGAVSLTYNETSQQYEGLASFVCTDAAVDTSCKDEL